MTIPTNKVYTNAVASAFYTSDGTDTAPATYKWYLNGVSVGTDVSYTIPSDAAGKTLRVEITISNDCGTVTRSSDTLTVVASDPCVPSTITTPSLVGSPQPTWTLSVSSTTINEGDCAVFTVQTTNVPQGIRVPWTVTGVDQSRIVGGVTSGTLTIDNSGSAVVAVCITNNAHTDGPSTLTLSMFNGALAQSVLVNDTSTGPVFEVNFNDGTANDTGPYAIAPSILGTGATFDTGRARFFNNSHLIVESRVSWGSTHLARALGQLMVIEFDTSYTTVPNVTMTRCLQLVDNNGTNILVGYYSSGGRFSLQISGVPYITAGAIPQNSHIQIRFETNNTINVLINGTSLYTSAGAPALINPSITIGVSHDEPYEYYVDNLKVWFREPS